MSGSNKPLDFVQGVQAGEHLVLFYEDPRYAEKIEFAFLEEGLRKDESCVITTHGSQAALMKRMTGGGIDVERYRREGLLHVMKIKDPMTNPDGVAKGVEQVYDQMFSVVEEPFRIVSTTFKDVGDHATYNKEIQLEKSAQKTFDGGDPARRHRYFRDKEGTVMCIYKVEDFGSGNTGWLRTLSANHHAAIFAPKNTEGVAMQMRPVGGTEMSEVAH